jgi:peptide/nickel transport system permease protein
MAEGAVIRRRTPLRLWLSAGWLTLFFLAALFAGPLSPQDPLAQDLLFERLPPFWASGAEPGFFLGTDSLGRDVLSRLIHGAQIAAIVALVAGFGSCLIGTTLGLIAGYYRGWVDQVISRVVDVWMSFPAVLFAILLIAVIGTGLTSVIVAIIVIDWTRFCRVVRAETMAQARMDYVDSARIAGFSRAQTLWREVFPNVLPVIIAVLTLEMGIAIVVEAILSFVNLSISTDDPTWGGMIAEGRLSIHQAWWVLVFPMITLFLTVLSFTQLGEALRMRFDPVLR